MSKIVGIDLGTTNSVIAVMEGGEPIVIASSEGGRTVPSTVAFNKDGERLVGETAKRQATINPDNTIFSVKRFIGRNYTDPAIADEQRDMPYQLIRGPVGDVRVRVPVKNREYTPQEISAMVLGKLKTDAEAYLGGPVTKAVITVPAYFNDSQRQATKDAGKIAGLEVMRIINEPTAAALAYGIGQQTDQTILVFDLGGGTFDVSVLEVSDGVIEVLATNGDTRLGGDDWDKAVVSWIVSEFKREQGIDLATDRQALQRVREAAEKAKIELSSTVQTEINLPFITADASGPKHLQLVLTRAQFEQLTEQLLHRIKGPVSKALADADIATSSLDAVVLVGGSTRMPMVQSLVERLSGKQPNKTVNPDEVVALGAALQGGVLAGDVKDVLLLDVTPLSLGLETLGGVMTTLIPRNTTIPTRKTETFSTAEDSQTAVDVKVLQGERTMADDNTVLGIFRLDGLPPAPRGVPQVEVTFDIDANGILSVGAKDKATGREQSVTIQASTNLSQGDIDRMVQEAEQNSAEDQKRRALIDARNSADQITYQTEKVLAETENIPADIRSNVELSLSNLADALQRDDASAIQQRVSDVQAASMAIGQAMYHSGGDPVADDTVLDGEFEAA